MKDECGQRRTRGVNRVRISSASLWMLLLMTLVDARWKNEKLLSHIRGGSSSGSHNDPWRRPPPNHPPAGNDQGGFFDEQGYQHPGNVVQTTKTPVSNPPSLPKNDQSMTTKTVREASSCFERAVIESTVDFGLQTPNPDATSQQWEGQQTLTSTYHPPSTGSEDRSVPLVPEVWLNSEYAHQMHGYRWVVVVPSSSSSTQQTQTSTHLPPSTANEDSSISLVPRVWLNSEYAHQMHGYRWVAVPSSSTMLDGKQTRPTTITPPHSATTATTNTKEPSQVVTHQRQDGPRSAEQELLLEEMRRDIQRLQETVMSLTSVLITATAAAPSQQQILSQKLTNETLLHDLEFGVGRSVSNSGSEDKAETLFSEEQTKTSVACPQDTVDNSDSQSIVETEQNEAGVVSGNMAGVAGNSSSFDQAELYERVKEVSFVPLQDSIIEAGDSADDTTRKTLDYSPTSPHNVALFFQRDPADGSDAEYEILTDADDIDEETDRERLFGEDVIMFQTDIGSDAEYEILPDDVDMEDELLVEEEEEEDKRSRSGPSLASNHDRFLLAGWMVQGTSAKTKKSSLWDKLVQAQEQIQFLRFGISSFVRDLEFHPVLMKHLLWKPRLVEQIRKVPRRTILSDLMDELPRDLTEKEFHHLLKDMKLPTMKEEVVVEEQLPEYESREVSMVEEPSVSLSSLSVWEQEKEPADSESDDCLSEGDNVLLSATSVPETWTRPTLHANDVTTTTDTDDTLLSREEEDNLLATMDVPETWRSMSEWSEDELVVATTEVENVDDIRLATDQYDESESQLSRDEDELLHETGVPESWSGIQTDWFDEDEQDGNDDFERGQTMQKADDEIILEDEQTSGGQNKEERKADAHDHSVGRNRSFMGKWWMNQLLRKESRHRQKPIRLKSYQMRPNDDNSNSISSEVRPIVLKTTQYVKLLKSDDEEDDEVIDETEMHFLLRESITLEEEEEESDTIVLDTSDAVESTESALSDGETTDNDEATNLRHMKPPPPPPRKRRTEMFRPPPPPKRGQTFAVPPPPPPIGLSSMPPERKRPERPPPPPRLPRRRPPPPPRNVKR